MEERAKNDTLIRRLLKLGVVETVKNLLSVVIGVALVGSLVAKLLPQAYHLASDRNVQNWLILLIAVIGAFVSFTVLLLRYLSPARSKSEKVDERFEEARAWLSATNVRFDQALSEIKAKAAQPAHDAVLDEESRNRIVADIKSDLLDLATQDTLRTLIDGLKAEKEKDKRERVLRAELDGTVLRLETAIDELNQRANLNLVFGIVISLAGVGILLYLVITSPSEDTWLDFAKIYVPRLTVVVLIELFAYFFLKLYKASISETRYFHNEITNVAARRTALMTGLTTDDQGSVRQAISELLKTERNGTLTKSQTTVELAKAKMDLDSEKNIVGTLTKIIEAIAKHKPQDKPNSD